MIFTISIIVIMIVILIYIIVIYNNLIFARNRIRQAMSNIDVLLKQRNDELGNLINVVKGYSKFEQSVLEKITRIRSGYDEDWNVKKKSEFNKEMQAQVKSLFALIENYPDIKANEQYMRLQKRITSLENQIADRREYYNWSVTNFNTRIEQFPYSIIANFFKFMQEPLFKL